MGVSTMTDVKGKTDEIRTGLDKHIHEKVAREPLTQLKKMAEEVDDYIQEHVTDPIRNAMDMAVSGDETDNE